MWGGGGRTVGGVGVNEGVRECGMEEVVGVYVEGKEGMWEERYDGDERCEV